MSETAKAWIALAVIVAIGYALIGGGIKIGERLAKGNE